MAALYEINHDILDCIDVETGEIINEERLHSLQMDRKAKVRNIVCYIKNLLSDAKAYEEEEKVFAQRKATAKNKAENLKSYLSQQLQGETIKDKEFAVSWRKSQRLEISDIGAVPDWYLERTAPRVDKLGLKAALKRGEVYEGITLKTYNCIQIK